MASPPNRIRELREAKGWTQEALAYLSGVSLRTVTRAEKGDFTPTIETSMKLAKALRVRLDKLFIEEAVR